MTELEMIEVNVTFVEGLQDLVTRITVEQLFFVIFSMVMFICILELYEMIENIIYLKTYQAKIWTYYKPIRFTKRLMHYAEMQDIIRSVNYLSMHENCEYCGSSLVDMYGNCPDCDHKAIEGVDYL